MPIADKYLKVNGDHVYNSLEAWLKSIKVLRKDEVIEQIPDLNVGSDGMITIIRGKDRNDR